MEKNKAAKRIVMSWFKGKSKDSVENKGISAKTSL